MKPILTFLLLGINFSLVLSQGHWVPQSSTIHTPYGNTKITTYSYQNIPMTYGNRNYSPKYKFSVVLHRDSTLETRGRINFEEGRHSLRFKAGKFKQTLFPSETKEIYRITQSGERLVGIPADSCWLFRVETGRINLYSALPEEGDFTGVIAIQQNGSKPKALNRKNLEAIIGKDADSKVLELIAKGKLVKAARLYNEGN